MKPKLLLPLLSSLGFLVAVPSQAQDRAWTGGANANWGTSNNWSPIGTTFNNTTDLTFQGGAGNYNNFLSQVRTIRSLTYASNLTNAGTITHTLGNQATTNSDTARNLTFDSDSGNSFITVESGATSNVNIGFAGAGTQGNVVLSTNLNITNAGTGSLNFNRPITGTSRTVTISGSGLTTFNAANTYSGSTVVGGGTLLINGTTGSNNILSVSSNAVIGGGGIINGNLSLADGALFAFNPTNTLTVGGTFSLNPSFGIDSLRNSLGGTLDWSTINEGNYILINTSFVFDESNISNFGFSNRVTGLAGGKEAYFRNGSLELVVLPEPSTWALLVTGAAALTLWRRRSRR